MGFALDKVTMYFYRSIYMFPSSKKYIFAQFLQDFMVLYQNIECPYLLGKGIPYRLIMCYHGLPVGSLFISAVNEPSLIQIIMLIWNESETQTRFEEHVLVSGSCFLTVNKCCWWASQLKNGYRQLLIFDHPLWQLIGMITLPFTKAAYMHLIIKWALSNRSL